MSSRTLCASPGKMLCNKCERPVQLVKVAGSLVAVDPEVMAFVASGRMGEVVASGGVVTGRRVHAEMCTSYQLAADRERDRHKVEADRERHRRELAAYNRRNPRKTRAL